MPPGVLRSNHRFMPYQRRATTERGDRASSFKTRPVTAGATGLNRNRRVPYRLQKWPSDWPCLAFSDDATPEVPEVKEVPKVQEEEEAEEAAAEAAAEEGAEPKASMSSPSS